MNGKNKGLYMKAGHVMASTCTINGQTRDEGDWMGQLQAEAMNKPKQNRWK